MSSLVLVTHTVVRETMPSMPPMTPMPLPIAGARRARLATVRRTLAGALCLALFGAAGGAQSSVGTFDGQTDVGRVGHSGSAAYDPQRQAYLIAGSGQNMWDDRDDFHFVWKRMTGNFILSTRARFVGAEGDQHRRRHVAHDGFQDFRNSHAGLGAGENRVVGFQADEVLDLFDGFFRFSPGKIDLIDHRD